MGWILLILLVAVVGVFLWIRLIACGSVLQPRICAANHDAVAVFGDTCDFYQLFHRIRRVSARRQSSLRRAAPITQPTIDRRHRRRRHRFRMSPVFVLPSSRVISPRGVVCEPIQACVRYFQHVQEVICAAHDLAGFWP